VSVKLTAEIHITEVDGKGTEDDVSLIVENNDDDTLTNIVFFDREDKKLTITVDRDELLEAVARVSGGDIRLAKGDD
jgi:hypothetical protein